MGQGLKLLDIGVFSLGTPFLKGIVSLFGGGGQLFKNAGGIFCMLTLDCPYQRIYASVCL